MDWLMWLDTKIFTTIHQSMANPLSDAFFATLTDLNKQPWLQFILVPSILFIWIWRKQVLAITQILTLVVTIGITDGFCHYVLKPAFGRPRPMQAGLEVDKKSITGNSQYGFPSNHAANAYVGAYLLANYFPSMSMPLFFLALLISFSRVYLGVHYPLDVIGGAFIGIVMGRLVVELTSHFFIWSKESTKRKFKRKMTLKERLQRIKAEK